MPPIALNYNKSIEFFLLVGCGVCCQLCSSCSCIVVVFAMNHSPVQDSNSRDRMFSVVRIIAQSRSTLLVITLIARSSISFLRTVITSIKDCFVDYPTSRQWVDSDNNTNNNKNSNYNVIVPITCFCRYCHNMLQKPG